MRVKNKFKLTYQEWLGKMFCLYRDESAASRNLDFSLTLKDVEDLIVGKKCFYCDKSPSYKESTQDKGVVLSCGIDRVDNSRGYSRENCVSCCKKCNYNKRDFTFERLKNLNIIFLRVSEFYSSQSQQQ